MGGGEKIFGSNHSLASRATRGKPQNQWTALRADHQMLGEKSETEILERVTGIEPVTYPWEGHILPLNYTRKSLI